MATVTYDTSPADLLARFRGPIVGARPAYPDAIHLDLTDSSGGLWRFGTWHADYSPADPDALLGRSVTSAELDERTGTLRVRLSDGTRFTVTPGSPVDEEIENWELFTPEGLVLTYGPRGRWQLGNASDPC